MMINTTKLINILCTITMLMSVNSTYCGNSSKKSDNSTGTSAVVDKIRKIIHQTGKASAHGVAKAGHKSGNTGNS